MKSLFIKPVTHGLNFQGFENRIFKKFKVFFIYLGIGWYFNMLYPHTELFGKFISDSIETGLIDAWKERTWAGMRNEYLDSGEEKIVLPDGNIGGEFYIIV